MSSLTKSNFAEELQDGNAVLAALETSLVEKFIDRSLRAYSERLPKVKVSPDNSVVTGQEYYDFPSGALRITALRAVTSGKEIIFTIEDAGSGKKIKPGNVKTRSYEELLDADYYSDPVAYQTGSGDIPSYSKFDIEFIALQTMESISDDGLEALGLYVEYLAYNYRASVVLAGDGEDEEVAESITDADSSGASTTVRFRDNSKQFEAMAKEKLEAFEAATTMPYGTR